MAKKAVKYCVVDAFTDSAFKGNPAAVCLLEEERDDEWLQAVATEFNLSETCYLTRLSDSSESPIGTASSFRLRWFTPVAEVELCGHATLAAAHVLFTNDLVNSNTIEFSTLSGILTAKIIHETKLSDSSVSEKGNRLNWFLIELDFPVVPIYEYAAAGGEISSICKSINVASVDEIHKTTSDDLLVLLPSGKAVLEFEPDFAEMEKLPGRGMIVTGLAATGSGYDFYSRFFCPKLGINEDPVTGSVHCALVPFWSKKLGKRDFVAYQASPRSGILHLQLDEENERVLLRGKAVTVMEGTLFV